MLYAVAAVRLDDRVQTRGDLLAVLQRNPAAIRTLRLSATGVMGLAISPDGRLLASGDDAGTVRFTDLRSWKPSGGPVQLRQPIAPQAMHFSPDGRTLAVGTRQGNGAQLYLVDVVRRGHRRIGSWRKLGETTTPTTSLAYAPDGRRLAVSLATVSPTNLTPVAERLLLVDARSGRPVWRRGYPLIPGQWEAHLAFRSDGVLISSAQQGETLLWDAQAGRIVRRYPIGGRFDLSPDGQRLAIALDSPYPGDPAPRCHGSAHRAPRAAGRRAVEAWNQRRVHARRTRSPGARVDSSHIWDTASGAMLETYGTKRGPRPWPAR